MADDYSTLSLRIIDELDRAGETSVTARVQLEILSAVRHYNMDRFWFEETQTAVTTVASTTYVAVPSDVVDLETVTVTYNGHPYDLTERSWEWYRAIGGDDTSIGKSVPDNYVTYGDRIYLYPVPDATYTLTLGYLKTLATLSGATDTNTFTALGEEMIRQRAKAAYKVNYLEDMAAKQELTGYAVQGYYSAAEMVAHRKFLGYSNQRISTGRITPASF